MVNLTILQQSSAFIISLLLIPTLNIQGQPQTEFYKGKLILSEGSQLEGLIQYHSGNEVKFKTSGIEQVFNASEIDWFSFWCEDQQKFRKFYVLPLKEHSVKPYILEVLAETNAFVFLIRKESIISEIPVNPSRHSKGRYIPRNIARVYGTVFSEKKTETFYFLSIQKGMIPYLRLTYEADNVSVKYLNKFLLEEIAGKDLNQLLGYKNEKDSKPVTNSDLLKLIKDFSNLYQALPSKGELIRPL